MLACWAPCAVVVACALPTLLAYAACSSAQPRGQCTAGLINCWSPRHSPVRANTYLKRLLPALQRLPAAAVFLALQRLPPAALQAGFLLTLSIPDDDKFLDDKLDILELNGLQQTSTFTLFPNRAPSQEMTAFLRLMNLQGETQSAACSIPAPSPIPQQALPFGAHCSFLTSLLSGRPAHHGVLQP